MRYSTCTECGAVVENMTKHQDWHDEVSRKIDDAIIEAKRAKKAAHA